MDTLIFNEIRGKHVLTFPVALDHLPHLTIWIRFANNTMHYFLIILLLQYK